MQFTKEAIAPVAQASAFSLLTTALHEGSNSTPAKGRSRTGGGGSGRESPVHTSHLVTGYAVAEVCYLPCLRD